VMGWPRMAFQENNPTLATMRPSRRWGTQVAACRGLRILSVTDRFIEGRPPYKGVAILIIVSYIGTHAERK